MSEVARILRERIEAAQHGVEQAERAGHEHEVHLHSARLLELIDRAREHGIDVSEWVGQGALAAAAENVR